MADSDKVSLGSISTASTTPAQTQDAPPPASTTTPSHQRSMQGQTAASFVRAAAASTGDGAVPVVTTETDAPVVNETPAAEPPARKARAKRTGVKPAASLESVDGEEKKPRKNSNKWILERLTETTARVDKLTKGMVDRINSVKSSAESSAHEIATLRDKVARLEERVAGLRAERAEQRDPDDTGTESGEEGTRRKRKASTSRSTPAKRARHRSRSLSTRRSRRSGGSSRSGSQSPELDVFRRPSQDGDEGEWDDAGEDDDMSQYDSVEEEEAGQPRRGRSLLERLEVEKMEAEVQRPALADRLQWGPPPNLGTSTHDRGETDGDLSESPPSLAHGKARREEKKRRAGSPPSRQDRDVRSNSPPSPPKHRGNEARQRSERDRSEEPPQPPRAPLSAQATDANARYSGRSQGFSGRGQGFDNGGQRFNGGGQGFNAGGQGFGGCGGFRGGFRGGRGRGQQWSQRGGNSGGGYNANAPLHQNQYASSSRRSPSPPGPPPFRAPEGPKFFPAQRPEVRIGEVAWVKKKTFEDVCGYAEEIKRAGCGPVPLPKAVGEPEGRKERYVVARFHTRHDAVVFSSCWNRWCEKTEKYNKTTAMLAND